MNQQRRQPQGGESSAVQILVRGRALVGDPAPGRAVRPDEITPLLAVIAREHFHHARAEGVGIVHHGVEERSRPRLAPATVGRFENQPGEPLWCGEPRQQGDHGAVAVAPEHRAIEPERVDYMERFGGRALVKVHFLPIEPARIGHAAIGPG